MCIGGHSLHLPKTNVLGNWLMKKAVKDEPPTLFLISNFALNATDFDCSRTADGLLHDSCLKRGG